MGLRLRIRRPLRDDVYERDNVELVPRGPAGDETKRVLITYRKGSWQYDVLKMMEEKGFSVATSLRPIIEAELRDAAKKMNMVLKA